MLSKTKKHSKTASSKLSYSYQTSPSSSSNLTPNPDVEFSEEELLSTLDEAYLKYPSLIGKTAVIGKVTEDVGEVVDSKGCKIWLSQSSMVAYSINPGSTESVLKNGVRLSSSLSCMICCPGPGRIVVYPVHSQSVEGLIDGSTILHITAVSCFSLYNYKKLYLLSVVLKVRSASTMNSNLLTRIDFPAETIHDSAENEKISSPKTPVFSQSKLRSPNTNWLNSTRYEEPVSNSANAYGTSLDVLIWEKY